MIHIKRLIYGTLCLAALISIFVGLAAGLGFILSKLTLGTFCVATLVCILLFIIYRIGEDIERLLSEDV